MSLPHWERCLPWIEASLAEEHHSETAADVFEMIVTGQAQFWPGEDACAVTEIATDAAGTFINLWIVGGDLGGVLALLPAEYAWARTWNCTEARFRPQRKGWARVMRKHGFENRDGFLRRAI